MIAPGRRCILVLVAVVAVGAYFRLWNIEHTFNVIHDFDEGAYAIGARAIADGSLPYRDFILIHPPLFNLVLAAGYRVLGYDFMLGRYSAVLFSVACIPVLYILGKRLQNRTAGLVGAAFFAASGLPVYLGRRGVQDSLGLFLLLLGLLLAFEYVSSKRGKYLVLTGCVFGLAVATKYLFLPVVIGSVLAVLLCVSAADEWKQVRRAAAPRFWALYAAVSVCLYALLMLLRRLVLAPVPLPLLDPLYPSPASALVVTLVFLVPVPSALFLLGHRLRWRHLSRELPLWLNGRRLVLLLAGAAFGFFVVVGPLFVQAPVAYLRQTLLLHQQRNIGEVPSFVGLVRVLPVSDVSLLLTSIPLLCAVPIMFLLLRRGVITRSGVFLAVTLSVAFLLCQAFPPMPRYYICVYPLVFLGLGHLVGSIDVNTRRRTAYLAYGAACVLFLVSLVSSVDILLRYSPDASVRDGRMYTTDERAYTQVAATLRREGAHKVYAVNPAFAAMAPGTGSSIHADSLAELFLERRPAMDLLADLTAEGVDHIVLDPWLTYWGDSWGEARLFVNAVRSNSRLVEIVPYGNTDHVEIYRLGAEPGGLFNGEFVLWDRHAGLDYPAGWQPVLLEDGWNSASVGRRYSEGRSGVALSVFSAGQADEHGFGVHAGITQSIPFPEGLLFLEVQCSEVTEVVGAGARGPAIHFLDDAGHSLIVGFSDTISEERVYPCESCDESLVMLPARRGVWQFYSLNIRQLWSSTGWPEPENIRILAVVSADDRQAGYYEFLVAGILTE